RPGTESSLRGGVQRIRAAPRVVRDRATEAPAVVHVVVAGHATVPTRAGGITIVPRRKAHARRRADAERPVRRRTGTTRGHGDQTHGNKRSLELHLAPP